MKVAYLGPQGSYSSLAVQKLCPAGDGVPCGSFYAVCAALVGGAVDYAVLPVENTLQGAVAQNLDLLYETGGLVAIREYLLPVDHRLITRPNVPLSKIRRVFSHEQAILQCGRFIAHNLPDAQIVYTDSTAASLAGLESETDAGIVGAHLQKKGYVLSAENIADEKNNFTHFLLVANGERHLPQQSARVFLAASCPHEAGALLKMLQILAVYDLNMTKIESRPQKNSPGEYNFFIEFEGNIADGGVRAALARLREYADRFQLLGCY